MSHIEALTNINLKNYTGNMEQKMEQPAMVNQPHTLSLFGAGIDTVGILIGLFSIFLVIRALGKVGGQVGAAFKFTLVGVIAQTLALTYNLLTVEIALISLPTTFFGGLIASHHLHDGLMIIGLIFFVLAAQQFSKLST